MGGAAAIVAMSFSHCLEQALEFRAPSASLEQLLDRHTYTQTPFVLVRLKLNWVNLDTLAGTLGQTGCV